MMGSIISVESPAPRDQWHELVALDAAALIEQAPVWTDAIEAATSRKDASRLYRLDDGRRFVLPLVGRRPGRGSVTGFGTGLGIGGPVGPDLDANAVAAIAADLSTSPAMSTLLRPNPMQAAQWEGAQLGSGLAIPRRSHVVLLDGGVEQARRRMQKSARRGIRQADTAGVEVTVHLGGEQLDAHHQLHLASLERWARQQREPVVMARFRAQRRDPLTRLQTIAATLGDSFRLYLGRVDGIAVASNVVLWGPHNAHATRGATNDVGRSTKAGYAVEWAALADAATDGFGAYHLGESGQNRALGRYKERFGAVAVDYSEIRFERLPLYAIDNAARSTVKKVIGFRDV